MRKQEIPSNRSFGWVFSAFFTLAGAYSLWRGGKAYPWDFALAAVIAMVTIVRPAWLGPLNRLWMKFGDLLNRVVSPVVLAAIFYGVVHPVRVVVGVAGREHLKR